MNDRQNFQVSARRARRGQGHCCHKEMWRLERAFTDVQQMWRGTATGRAVRRHVSSSSVQDGQSMASSCAWGSGRQMASRPPRRRLDEEQSGCVMHWRRESPLTTPPTTVVSEIKVLAGCRPCRSDSNAETAGLT